MVHLQKDVNDLSTSVQSKISKVIKNQQDKSQTYVSSTDPCFVYVRVVCCNLKDCLGKTTLEEALHCKVIQYAIFSDLPYLKVKIAKKDLFRAFNADTKLLKVRLWESASSSIKTASSALPGIALAPSATCTTSELRITSWNCRGIG